jgi:acyl-CoA thioester hydrolase
MSKQIFTTTTRVIYGDTDAAGVVYNANFLRYFEIGRTEMMRAWVCPYREIEKQGLVLPVTESWLRHKAPAHYDDLLLIEVWVDEISTIKCKFCYRISRQDPDGNPAKLLVKGYTIHVAINRDGKLSRLPAEITDKLISLCDQEK